MRNTFPDVFFKILLNFTSDFVAVRKTISGLISGYQIVVIIWRTAPVFFIMVK